MIALDTNILVYAHRQDSRSHAPARHAISHLLRGRDPWAIPWPCVHEFISIVTNERIYAPPTSVAAALKQVSELHDLGVQFLHESADHLASLTRLAVPGNAHSGRIHDARIAAICIENGVTTLWTADRDFRRFPALISRNPLPDFA